MSASTAGRTLNPAKAMAMTVIDLLANGGTAAESVLAGFQPRFTRDDYLTFARRPGASFTYDGAADT